MKICVIGCGNMAMSTHLPAMVEYKNRVGGIEIIGCADLNHENAVKLKNGFSIGSCYGDYEKMLDELKPDAVVNLTNVAAIADVSENVLDMGYPVLMEKPPGEAAADTLRIAAASERSGKMSMVAFNRRYMPVMREAKRRIEGRSITHIDYCLYCRKRYDSSFEFTGIHAVDAAKFLAGSDYKNVEIFYQELPHFGEKVANYFLFCEFESGATANVRMIADTHERCEKAEIHLDSRNGDEIVYVTAPRDKDRSGSGSIEAVSGGYCVYRAEGSDFCQTEESYELHGFYGEHEAFYNYLKEGKPSPDDAASAVQSVAISECIKNRVRAYKK